MQQRLRFWLLILGIGALTHTLGTGVGVYRLFDETLAHDQMAIELSERLIFVTQLTAGTLVGFALFRLARLVPRPALPPTVAGCILALLSILAWLWAQYLLDASVRSPFTGELEQSQTVMSLAHFVYVCSLAAAMRASSRLLDRDASPNAVRFLGLSFFLTVAYAMALVLPVGFLLIAEYDLAWLAIGMWFVGTALPGVGALIARHDVGNQDLSPAS